jgi:hypothetical protein
VQAKRGAPDISEARPADGWESLPDQLIRDRILNVEQRSGKLVYRCEAYWGPDPTRFLGLEYNWFFYDQADVLVDIDWQYHTD